MPLPGIVKQGLMPLIATGVIAASVFSAVTTKSGLRVAGGMNEHAELHELWRAGAAETALPIDAALLAETGDSVGASWVETRAAPSTVGRVYGKLVVAREFGPSDEADADDIVLRPEKYLVAISIGFRPYTAGADNWIWARFAPNGALLNKTGGLPSPDQLASLANAYCSAPLASEAASRS